MRRTALAAAAAATVAFASAVPAEAQNYKSAVGVYGGGVWYSDLNRGSSQLDGFGDLPATLRLPARGIGGAQLERYFGNSRQIGLRLNGAFSESPLRRRAAVSACARWGGASGPHQAGLTCALGPLDAATCTQYARVVHITAYGRKSSRFMTKTCPRFAMPGL
jgi:hypothetical protein